MERQPIVLNLYELLYHLIAPLHIQQYHELRHQRRASEVVVDHRRVFLSVKLQLLLNLLGFEI